MKHIVLAGTSRSGKTTLSLMLSRLGYTHYKLDSIKRGIYNNFILDDGHNWKEVSPKISVLIERMLEDYYTDTNYLEEHYVIDTCHLFPKDACRLKREDTIVIFLGYTDIDVEKEVELLKRNDKMYYWSYHLGEEKRREIALANLQFSNYLKEECKKYDILYFDTGKEREQVLGKIVDMIKNLK